jgi:hypothetical protein
MKRNKENRTLTDNNQWRGKALINVHAVGFGFLLQDIWGTGTKPWKKFGMFDI